jgi:hypothetical protein
MLNVQDGAVGKLFTVRGVEIYRCGIDRNEFWAEIIVALKLEPVSSRNVILLEIRSRFSIVA